jgi:hypothetical protein
MSRMQLIEIHEQSWCPAAVREGATDCLNAIANWGRQYEYVIPKLRYALQQTQARRVIDLCSGSGGPWLQLYTRFDHLSARPLEIVLTAPICLPCGQSQSSLMLKSALSQHP